MSSSEVQCASAEADCMQNWKAMEGRSDGFWRYFAGNINLFASDTTAWWGMGKKKGMEDASELGVHPAVLLTHSAHSTRSSLHVMETFRAARSDREVSSWGTQGYQMKIPRYIIRLSSGEVLCGS